jgi:hypothetical protein
VDLEAFGDIAADAGGDALEVVIIGFVVIGKLFPWAGGLIEGFVGGGGGHAFCRFDYDEDLFGLVFQWGEDLTIAFGSGESADEEVRDIGTDRECDFSAELHRYEFGADQIEASKEARGIGRTAAKPGFGWNLFVEGYFERADSGNFADESEGFGERVVGGKVGPVADDFIFATGGILDAEVVGERYRLEI